MSYQVLALKYRPLTFEDVIAQDHITKTLARAVDTGRVAHGYLFTGPRGTGKTTTARILAKALNCAEGPTSTPCNKCPACREITSGSSLDVLEIDAASNTGVDDVRTLRENIRYLPTSGKKRVFIIDEVHRLSPSAFDALLKTLEEPPDHAVFIFATTEPHKVPATILSRTQRYDFRRVRPSDLVAHMKRLAGLEKVEIDDEALYLIARKGEGSVRDSLSLMDQMIALTDGRITLEETSRTLGIVDRQLLEKLLEIIAAGKSAPVFELVHQLFESGADITEFVNDFIDYLRNILIQKSAAHPEELIEVSDSEREALMRQAVYFTEADILRMIQILSELLAELKRGYDERIFLEIALVRLARMESSITLQEVIERINALAGGRATGTVSAEKPGGLFDGVKPARTSSPERKEEIVPPAPPPVMEEKKTVESPIRSEGPFNLPRVQMDWKKFLEFLRGKRPMLASMMTMGDVRTVKDNKISYQFVTSAAANKQVVEKKENQNAIEEALSEFFGRPVRIAFKIDKNNTVKPAAAKVGRPEPIKADDLFEKDPELKKMIDQIDGEIISRKKVD